MNVGGPISQLKLAQYEAQFSIAKTANEAEQAIVEVIAETVEAGKTTSSRGNTVNISV